jgi:hypothetical protein
VRDTKLEKTNHEATPKHQGNLKRFLRDLHRGHEKDEKDKERAKAEVARLNGISSGSGPGGPGVATSSGFGRGPTPSIPKAQATPAQRKQQLAQLAEMGVAIPDEFRPDMAMVGQWQVTSERIIESDGKKKPDSLALGVRKREVGDEDEEELEAKRRRWGSAYRSHPTEEDDGDLDALLSNATRKGAESVAKTDPSVGFKIEIKKESGLNEVPAPAVPDLPVKVEIEIPDIKKEPSDGELPSVPSLDAIPKQEEEEAAPGIVFKKRKAKKIRQK